ncbi:sulfite oxidase [Alicyclobacillus acidoterrestris]|uniref:sulfite oxidase n=1 Tax=Alicyclobacillus acidoterrestris TaxID=1450 RepID=UPI0022A9E51F|nr:sulfite oxidase [Alicyclobacillus acidoterrestris]
MCKTLKKMKKTTVQATLECAGNKRSLFKKKAQGNQFGLGAISHAVWGGVRLRDLLNEAGIAEEAKEVIFQGMDAGSRNDMPGQLHFARSLPVAQALAPDTLLAYEMNGSPLPDKHGFPLRLIVPGWYGIASVKWLHKITVTDEPFTGPFQVVDYVVLKKPNNFAHATPVTTVFVNSTIANPTDQQELALGTHRIAGYAWNGPHALKKVEVSTDGGKHWREASFLDPDIPYSWRRWTYEWTVQKPGQYAIMSKATNELGESQPMEAPWNVKGYLNHSIHCVQVHVVKLDPKFFH